MSRKPTRKPTRVQSVVIPNDSDAGKVDDTGNENGNASSSGAGTVDPASIAGASDNGNDNASGEPVKRRRGRPPGSGNASKAAKVPVNVSGLEKLLLGIHTSLAFVAAPEWAMETDEARELAQASADVLRHYKPEFLDQKTVDWINLIQCVGIAYGGRFMAMRERKRADRNKPVNLREVKNPEPFREPPPSDNARAARVGEIPGLGKVEFPPGHPLAH